MLPAPHSYPETLVRVGLFADWFEFRIAQNFDNEKTIGPLGSTSAGGAEDLYLGCKLSARETAGLATRSCVDSSDDCAHGLAEFYRKPGFGRTEPCLQLANHGPARSCASTVGNGVLDTIGQTYLEMSQSAAVHFKLTQALSLYVEAYGIFPHHVQGVSPQYYSDGGFSLMVNDDLEVDIRAGVGLNEQADNFFTGIGGGVRF